MKKIKLLLATSTAEMIIHALKVACFIFVSAGLTGLLDSLAKLNLDQTQFFLATTVINALLAGLNKKREQLGIMVF